MDIVEVEGATDLMAKPKNWDDEKMGSCRPLPVRVEMKEIGKTEDGFDLKMLTCTSAWKPTREELALLNSGAVIELVIAGQQPPCRLGVAMYKAVELDQCTRDDFGVAQP